MTIVVEQKSCGEVVMEAIYSCGIVKALVAFLEQQIANNYDHWTYDYSKFKDKIVSLNRPHDNEPFVAIFIKEDGTTIYATEK